MKRVEEVNIQFVICVFTQIGNEDLDDVIGGEQIENNISQVSSLVESDAYDAIEHFQRCLPHPHSRSIRDDIVEHLIEHLQLI